MKIWLVPVILVAVATFVVLFFLSYGTLEYQEIGLNYSWITETVSDKPYSSGRYYLGLGNHFIKFPKMVVTLLFTDDPSVKNGPAMQSRTKDGLNVRLEVSFQYRLLYNELYNLYSTLGPEYEKTYVRMAIEMLTTAATTHTAHEFFTNRSIIGQEMHLSLNKHFKQEAFAEVPFFQLRTVHLPTAFEDAIKDTQVKEQEIEIATLEQETNRVSFETTVIQAEQAVKVLENEAQAEAAAILAANSAYCEQYSVTQQLQSTALLGLRNAAAWDNNHLLEYLKIKAVREHPPERTTIRL